ncbi:MAG: hypothetical protein ABIN67_02850 [Ferruginibacter sp.]
MKTKKTITICLMLVLALQLLPVRQAVRYFFVDNLIIEEILDVNKNATKNFRLLDEDHFLWESDLPTPHSFLVSNTAFFHYAESLPFFHAADIHTPPPNRFHI